MSGPVFVAAFDSDCEECDELIQKGQEARMVGEGRAIHVTCPTPRPSRTETLCAACWTTHAGECL